MVPEDKGRRAEGTFDRVRAVMARQTSRREEDLTPETALLRIAQEDSLALEEYYALLEDEFGITFVDTERIVTLRDVARYIEARRLQGA